MVAFLIAAALMMAWLASMSWLSSIARDVIELQREVWKLNHPGQPLPLQSGWIDLPRTDRHHRGDK